MVSDDIDAALALAAAVLILVVMEDGLWPNIVSVKEGQILS